MKLQTVAGLLADMIIADANLAPTLRFAANAIKAAEVNKGEVPVEYSEQLVKLESEAERQEAEAIMAARLDEEKAGAAE